MESDFCNNAAPQPLPAIAGTQDGHRDYLRHIEQVLVARDQGVRLGQHRRGEHYAPALLPPRRPSHSTVHSSSTAKTIRNVATARMAGLICSRTPAHI